MELDFVDQKTWTSEDLFLFRKKLEIKKTILVILIQYFRMRGFFMESYRKQNKLTYYIWLLHCKVITTVFIIVTNMYPALTLYNTLYTACFIEYF